MIKSNSSIYLFPLHPVFSPEKTPLFESFDRENSVLFYSSLYENFREVFEPFANRVNIVYVIDESDKEFLPKEYLNENIEIFTGDTDKKNSLFKALGDKYFNKFNNNLVVFANSIAMTAADIEKVLNILNIEDEVLILEKTPVKEEITLIGFNSFNRQMFEEINWYDFKYKSVLRQTASHDHFLHVLTDHFVIKDLDDFRVLYKELSKKDSLAYCSHNMHERFTHLFIEYKELLK